MDGRLVKPMHSEATFAVSSVLRTGLYLDVPVLVVADEGDGWVIGLWPDRERPKRSHGKPRPFTFTKGEWWRFWGEQVKPAEDFEYEAPAFPLHLEPKAEGDE